MAALAPAEPTPARVAPRPRREPRRGRTSPVAALTYVILAVLAAFCVIPFVWLILASVDPGARPWLQLPASIDLGNFFRFVSDPHFNRFLPNSLILAGGATLVCTASAVLGGYALSRFRFRGRRALMFGILLTRVIPTAATIAPLYAIALMLGLVNTHVGLILIMAAQQLPLALWMLKGFFDTVPAELEEAAWIDGAGRLGSALRIVLPLAGPGVAASALFTFIEVWGDFLTPFILLRDPDLYPISLGLFRAYVSHSVTDWGILTSVAVTYMIPGIIFYLIVRRFLLKATVVGALHGGA
jgi:multiple sugar transport system permease protein